jgi:hypothetical protein
MRETGSGHSEGEIGRLREQIVGLVDADRVRVEDEEALLSALDAVLLALVAGDLPAARAGLEQFITEAQGLMAAGVLEGRADDPLLATACALLAALRGEQPGSRCGMEVRAPAPVPARHRKSFEHEHEHELKPNA